jgi:hypothetical protein
VATAFERVRIESVGRGWIAGERSKGVVGGHGTTAAVGYDLGPVGLSVRGMCAPASGTVLGTTGPPIAYVLATFDWRLRP